MKKFFLLIFINILLIILVTAFVEFYLYNENTKYLDNKPFYTWKKEDFSINSIKKDIREPSGLCYKKNPIIIYGCSVAYGFGLDKEQTFSYKLSEYTKRPVYNFGAPSRGLQHALFLLQNDEKIDVDPDFVFYVFINDHTRRMFVDCNRVDNVKYLTYKIENGKLKMNTNKYALTERLYLFNSIKNGIYYSFRTIFDKKIYEMTKLYFLAIKNEVSIKYPKAEFIVIDYDNSYRNYLTEERVKDLQKNGIKVISLNRIFNNKFKMDEYRLPKEKDIFKHPNSKAWDIIVKYISKEFKL